MNVGMTIGTLASRPGEGQIDVALHAGYAHMQSPKRKLRLLMIEIRCGFHRFPAFGSMAFLAGDLNSAMRVCGPLLTRQAPEERMKSGARDTHDQQQRRPNPLIPRSSKLKIPFDKGKQRFHHGFLPVASAPWHTEHSRAVSL